MDGRGRRRRRSRRSCVALRMKGETVDEIAGAAARDARARDAAVAARARRCVDTCGTGGDGAGTFNVSTAAALRRRGRRRAGGEARQPRRVVAAAAAPTCSRRSASASTSTPERRGARASTRSASRSCSRPRYHPAMRARRPVRRELGVRTIFNLLGPLTNPAGRPPSGHRRVRPGVVGAPCQGARRARARTRAGGPRRGMAWTSSRRRRRPIRGGEARGASPVANRPCRVRPRGRIRRRSRAASRRTTRGRRGGARRGGRAERPTSSRSTPPRRSVRARWRRWTRGSRRPVRAWRVARAGERLAAFVAATNELAPTVVG